MILRMIAGVLREPMRLISGNKIATALSGKEERDKIKEKKTTLVRNKVCITAGWVRYSAVADIYCD